jgi:hypothetical protein
MDKDNAINQYNAGMTGLSKRTGKLVTAVYLVTDCIDDPEPLKGRLRTLGVDLVSQVSFAEKSSAFDRGITLAEAALILSEMGVLISIAGSVSLISEMNASVLLGAIENLRKTFERGGSESFGLPSVDRASGTFVITKEMLSDSEEEEKMARHSELKSGQTTVKDINRTHSYRSLSKGQKTEKTQSGSSSSKTNRRDEILAIIKQKKEVSVKDIRTLISDCSEKTIQRELLALVSEGILKKVGEKRWSRYLLS